MRDTTHTTISSGTLFSLRVRLALAVLLFVSAVAVMTVALSGPANAIASAPHQQVQTVVWAQGAAEPAATSFDANSANGLLDSPALVLVLALIAAFAAVMAWRCAGPTTARTARAER